jgi:hypothetical protein
LFASVSPLQLGISGAVVVMLLGLKSGCNKDDLQSLIQVMYLLLQFRI